MKKLLIICLVLLTGCTNANAKVNKIEHQDIFDQVQLSDYQNVMIVAHPDDETIWGGMHLLKDKYLVVCLTNGDNEIRSKEFKEVMKKTQNTGLILNYPDKTNGKRDNWKSSYQKIEDDLNYLLSKQHFNLVVTHNPKGEYGHQHHKMTSAIVDDSFNMISVDGDTSTNDTALVLANGMAGNKKITEEGADYNAFYEGLSYVFTELSKMIAGDGEGCTCLFEVQVKGATTKAEAKTLAKSIVTSSLTKAAIFGHDANWGRILCAMGYSGADFDPEKV
ncbi:MAG TPA: bifunctional ornithine acetyltransferase/N-acetylglutamate synthase, partial [Thomasclavelia ramosa]|nr:bifunctional ornithine acetyltransferase/N-acetylglutamate synthase [Thomasclavelia ramosa]